jgi:hypothetical protein
MTQPSGPGITFKGRAIAGMAIGLALFSVALVVRDTVIRIKGDKRDYSIEVAGAARRTIKATRVSWEGALELTTHNVSEGHVLLEQVREHMRAFFVAQGLEERAVHFTAVDVQEQSEWDQGQRRRVVTGQLLTLRVRIEAGDGEALARVVGRSADLIDAAQISDGAYRWHPGNVRYDYDGFDGIKQQVLAAAVQNARLRAAAMAESAGVVLGELRQIELGDLQVRSPGSNSRYSDDAETPTKDVIADVKLLYHVRR